jgi:hypothetical protein
VCNNSVPDRRTRRNWRDITPGVYFFGKISPPRFFGRGLGDVFMEKL